MTKPISPDDIKDMEYGFISDRIVEVLNRLIPQAWDGEKAVMWKAKIRQAAPLHSNNIKEWDVKEPHFLGAVVLFKKAGWNIEAKTEKNHGTVSEYYIFTVPKLECKKCKEIYASNNAKRSYDKKEKKIAYPPCETCRPGRYSETGKAEVLRG